MRVTQQRLFPDPQPLVERLGREFFRQLPEVPGIYLMRDRSETVLYVGKAKNLRRRLCSYRVANPERMPRRTLRLLRLVAQITYEQCDDESKALRRESELLLSLKPRFNRAGVWQGPKRFLAWRCSNDRVQLAVTEAPEAGWEMFGPMGSHARVLRVALMRLLWFAANPELGVAGMPMGWAHGRIKSEAAISVGHVESAGYLAKLFGGQPQLFSEWIQSRMCSNLHPFVKSAVEQDLEFIDDLFGGN